MNIRKGTEGYTGNPFRRVKYITPIDEIIKISIKKSKRAKLPKRRKKTSREEKIALKEATYISIFSDEMIKYLNANISQFPSVETIHPFYLELLDLIASSSNVKRILGRINGIIKEIERIKNDQLAKLKATEHPIELAKIRKETLGKIISLTKKAEKDLKYLIRVLRQLKTIPDFDPNIPTIVVAGAPNVGKSSLVRIISTAKTEVGEYPFTTKKIIFGHRKVNFLNVQIVDTPGILDKPFKERSPIEKQTITTMEHIADLIIFIFDISDDAELSIQEQLNLITDITASFKKARILKVLNKIDLLTDDKLRIAKEKLKINYFISIKKGLGINKLIGYIENEIMQLLKTSEKFSPLLLIKISDEYKNNAELTSEKYEL